nr:disease resistance protein rps4 [Quercus suber]
MCSQIIRERKQFKASNIEQLWTDTKSWEMLKKLTVLNLEDLSENHFGYLPESIAQLSNLYELQINGCTSLQSVPKLPSNIGIIAGIGCSSLETNSSFQPSLLSNCSKLTGNQVFIDLFFAVIKKYPQGLYPKNQDYGYLNIFPGSEIPEWFSHQCMGDEVNIMEPFSQLCNDWIGIAICLVFCLPCHQNYIPFDLIVNGNKHGFRLIYTGQMVASSDHVCLLYLLPQLKLFKKEFIESLWECDANGFREIGIKIDNEKSGLVKKCGLRVESSQHKECGEELSNYMQ